MAGAVRSSGAVWVWYCGGDHGCSGGQCVVLRAAPMWNAPETLSATVYRTIELLTARVYTQQECAILREVILP